MTLSKTQQEAQIDIWSPYLNNKKLFKENIDSDSYKLMQLITKEYEKIHSSMNNDAYDLNIINLTSMHLYEANAVLIQLQNLYNVWDNDKVEYYLHNLADKKPKYGFVIDTLRKLYSKKIPTYELLQVMHTIITWTLCGDYTTETQELDMPVRRFLRVLKFCLDGSPPPP